MASSGIAAVAAAATAAGAAGASSGMKYSHIASASLAAAELSVVPDARCPGDAATPTLPVVPAVLFALLMLPRLMLLLSLCGAASGELGGDATALAGSDDSDDALRAFAAAEPWDAASVDDAPRAGVCGASCADGLNARASSARHNAATVASLIADAAVADAIGAPATAAVVGDDGALPPAAVAPFRRSD